MKYCEGGCRRKYIKSEGNALACKYNKSFFVDRKSDNKRHELCSKPNYFKNIFYSIIRSIFGDIMDMDNLGGGRRSNIVGRNQDIFKDRDEKLL